MIILLILYFCGYTTTDFVDLSFALTSFSIGFSDGSLPTVSADDNLAKVFPLFCVLFSVCGYCFIVSIIFNSIF